MKTYYGKHVRFTAQQGCGDALAETLIVASEDFKADVGCVLWVISRAADDSDVVWLTEVWVSEEAHDQAVQGETARQRQEEGVPLVAGVQETLLDVLGGKGV